MDGSRRRRRLLPNGRYAQLSAHGNRVVVRYRFSEAAQAALLIGGRRVVLTRFAPLPGTILWRGRVRRAVTLVAIDPAGNRSRPHSLVGYSIDRALALACGRQRRLVDPVA